MEFLQEIVWNKYLYIYNLVSKNVASLVWLVETLSVAMAAPPFFRHLCRLRPCVCVSRDLHKHLTVLTSAGEQATKAHQFRA